MQIGFPFLDASGNGGVGVLSAISSFVFFYVNVTCFSNVPNKTYKER